MADMRDEFEAALMELPGIKAGVFGVQRVGDAYDSPFQAGAWWAWQAARRAPAAAPAPVAASDDERSKFEAWHWKHYGRAPHRAKNEHGGSQAGIEYWGDDTNDSRAGWLAALYSAPMTQAVPAAVTASELPTDEDVARAIMENNPHPDDYLLPKSRDLDHLRYDGALVRAYLRAALAAAPAPAAAPIVQAVADELPDGWVIVPDNMDDAMLEAAQLARCNYRAEYRAAIAAAPKLARAALTTSTADAKDAECRWTPMNDDSGAWEMSCRSAWWFPDGTPEENGIKFCPCCGKRAAITSSAGEVKP